MKTDSTAPHILCVHPWIYDFAAFDFWSKPLGLFYLMSILRDQGIRVSYIDCLDRFHPRQSPGLEVMWDGRGPYRKTTIEPPPQLKGTGRRYSRYGIEPQWLVDDLRTLDPPDLILVTSLMTYWSPGVAHTISVIKSVWPDIPVVLGGIYVSLFKAHAAAHSGADEVVPFAGEPQLADIVKRYTGYEFNAGCDGDDLDAIPFPAFDIQQRINYIPLMTSRGCPFSCEYCASAYLEPRLRRRSYENVLEEISFWHQAHQVKNFPFYDDALLVNGSQYAFVLFEKIISSGMDVWFHTPNGVHVREISAEAAHLMKQAGFKSVRLGVETTDFSKERPHDAKLVSHEFEQTIANLKAAGFERHEVGAYLLCGLPGQQIEQVIHSIEMVRAAGIHPALAYYTPLPHTKMWDQAVSMSRFNLENHPECTNNCLFPCVNSPEEIQRINRLKNHK